jgi:NADH-quinone oxidoreductase subunit H
MYYLAEYLNMVTVATLATLIFFAGWHPTFWWLPAFIPFLLKIILFLFLYIWLRGTLPRLRYDMLMRFGWKVLLPLSMLNVIVTAIVLVAVQA